MSTPQNGPAMCIHGAPAPCGICKLSKGPVRYAVNSSAPKTPEQMAYAAGQRDMLNKVKNSPLSMTGYRIACGINWAFWTVVFTVGVFAVRALAQSSCAWFLLACPVGMTTAFGR